MSCHTFERIARSKHDADAMYGVLKRMTTYAINTSPEHEQKRAKPRPFNETTFRDWRRTSASSTLQRCDVVVSS